MKQIQTIILERGDMRQLKEGEALVINLSDGKSIELIYSEGHKHVSKNGSEAAYNGDGGTLIEKVAHLIVKPMTVRELTDQVDNPVQSVRGAVDRLVERKKAKAIKVPGHPIRYQAVEA